MEVIGLAVSEIDEQMFLSQKIKGLNPDIDKFIDLEYIYIYSM